MFKTRVAFIHGSFYYLSVDFSIFQALSTLAKLLPLGISPAWFHLKKAPPSND